MTSPDRRGALLARVERLDTWLHLSLVVLVVSAAVRYVLRHPLDSRGVLVLVGAGVLLAAYLARPLVERRGGPATWWVAAVVVIWAGLAMLAPSFSWAAVPIAFAVLQLVPPRTALAVVVVLTLVAGASWSRMVDGLDPTVVVGPATIALVTWVGYASLAREAETRQRLLDEVTEAQAALAVAQREAGREAERARLSRELHDSLGQHLSSIALQLGAADQALAGGGATPAGVRPHLELATSMTREALDEVRRVVRGLPPTDLVDPDPGALPAALERVVAGTLVDAAQQRRAELRVHGRPVPVSPDVAAAVVRTARGALANVREHAAAGRAVVTLTYETDAVTLDVRDDGRGFVPGRQPTGPLRGRGLAGIRERATALGGRADVESAPGDGTSVRLSLPVGGTGGEA